MQFDVPVTIIGGLPIAVIDRAKSAVAMVDCALTRRRSGRPPLVITSANGQILSVCARQPQIRDLFLQADLIHADGMPLVFASRLFGSARLPERVATTDLFHDVAHIAQDRGASFFLLGGEYPTADEAARRVRALYPQLRITGHSGGYMRRQGDEDRIIDIINDVRPDILWVGMGAPRELEFAIRNRNRLRGVGVIKTAGGLFDFVSGRNTRAPAWMQTAGLEWAYRTYLEPRRLAPRYILTNPHALFVMLTRSENSARSYPVRAGGK
jgi:exopolysaccharide biosynthesis WecB/TagA/CpsF family protein